MSEVKLYGFAPSTFVRTARMVCEEKGIDYALLPLEFRQPSHAVLHPYLKMPAMTHGDVSLYETLAIAIYINEVFPGIDLQSGDAEGRGRMFQWISAANDYLYEGVVRPLAGEDSLSDEVIQRAKDSLWPLEQSLESTEFISGNELTLADLFVSPMLLFADSKVSDDTWLDDQPRIRAWLTEMRDRASVRNTTA